MGITLKQLESRLRGKLGIVPPASTRDIIREALRQIYDDAEWGCFFQETYIRTPALITGIANMVQFSQSVVVDAATKALIDAITVDQVSIIERQLRITSPTQTDRAFWYNITAYDETTGTLTLDVPFHDITNAAAQIQIVKVFYSAPQIDIGTPTSPNVVTDFKRLEYVVSPYLNRRLLLDVSLNQLHMIDPSRIRTGDPRAFVTHSFDSDGNPRFEMYPVPIFERILRIQYLRNGIVPQKDTDQVPNIFSQALILARAKIEAYEYAIANQEELKLNGTGRFLQLIALMNSPNNANGYPALLELAKKKDEEMYPKAYVGNFGEIPYHEWNFGIWGASEFGFMGETIVIDAQYPN